MVSPSGFRCDIPTCLLLPTGSDFQAVKGTGGVCVCVCGQAVSVAAITALFVQISSSAPLFPVGQGARLCAVLCLRTTLSVLECVDDNASRAALPRCDEGADVLCLQRCKCVRLQV